MNYISVSATMETISVAEQPAACTRPKEGAKYIAAAKPVPASRQGKKEVPVFFNSWQIECEDRLVHQFDVTVSLELKDGNATKTRNLNKGPRDDALVAERSELIRDAIRAALSRFKMLSSTGAYVNDGGSILYTSENLKKSELHGFKLLIGALKTFSAKDLSGILRRDRDAVDQSVKVFYELMTSEDAVRRHTFDNFSKGRLYRADVDGRAKGENRFAVDVGFGQERRPGICKGFAPAEVKGQVIASLNLDVTTGTFWKAGKLLQTAIEINGWSSPQQAVWNAKAIRNTNTKLKDLRVSYASPDGKSSWDFQISGISAKAAATTQGESRTAGRMFSKHSQSVTTIDQLTDMEEGRLVPLAKKFGRIRYRTWPLVVSKKAKRREHDPTKFDVTVDYYPIEVLEVKANQRVPIELHGAPPNQPMRVEERFKQTNADLEALNLFGTTKGPAANPLLEAFGIKIVRKPLTSKAITRAMPIIEAKQPPSASSYSSMLKYTVPVNEKSFFATEKCAFQTPSHISVLHIGFAEEPRTFTMSEFADLVKSSAIKKGMRIEEVKPEIVKPNELYEKLKGIHEEKKGGNTRLFRALFLYVEPKSSEHH
ncbi:hypothetical protein PMAYCL1PPCAC_21234, partial [Pristionchus mayeri]